MSHIVSKLLSLVMARWSLSLHDHRRVPDVAPSIRQPTVPGRVHMVDPTGPGTAREKKGRVVIEADELWSFVGTKRNVHWVWLALNVPDNYLIEFLSN